MRGRKRAKGSGEAARNTARDGLGRENIVNNSAKEAGSRSTEAGFSSAGKKASGMALRGAKASVHRKVRESEDENTGVQAAHETEVAAERAGGRTAGHVKNKLQQKRRIKKNYAAAFRAENSAAAQAGTAAMPKEPAFRRFARGFRNFAGRNKGEIAVLGVCGLAAILMISAFGTMGTMFMETISAVIETTYLASDDEIHAADAFYCRMEEALQSQISRIERDYPGYDDYVYQVDEIIHNPYLLTSYLTVKYGNYTADQVRAELADIFEEQYSLYLHAETVSETVTRTVRAGDSMGAVVTSGYCNCSLCCGRWAGGPTASGVYPTSNHTLAVDAHNPFVPLGTHVIMNGTEYVVEDTGDFDRYGVSFDVYYDDHATAQSHGHQTWEVFLADSNGSNEIEVTETVTIHRLRVTLTNHGLDRILRNRMNDEEEKQYDIYNACYGNRDYLFPVTQLPLGEETSYEIPPEALSDVRFRNMITEAEKYLGYPYVWGGSSPETSFDCSGFVSWVINHCGNGWNYGRMTAEGLRNLCAYVSPSEARPGDLIFFQGTYDTSGASHVGIYVGDGKMIHCGNPIKYASIETSYWQQHFLSFGRLP